MKIELSARGGHERPTCVFCRDDVRPSDALGLCPGCGATFHEPCRAELSRCPTPGCVGLDEAAFAARQRGDEEAEREARRAAARARREAEDRARARTPSPPYAALSPETGQAPRRRVAGGDADVRRVTNGAELALVATAGALVGAAVGLFVAFATSRHGIGYGIGFDAFVSWVPLCVGVGAIEAAVIGLVGVRREPVVRWGKGDDASCLILAFVCGGMIAAMALAGVVGAPVVAGMVAGPLIALPLALRWFGFY